MNPDQSASKGVVVYAGLILQPRSYPVSKKVVHEIKFGDIAVMQI